MTRIKMNIQHPSFYMKPDWVKTIRQASPAAEKSSLIHPDQLAIIYDQHWFELLVPSIYSGLEKTIPELVRLEESISWVSGSVGWVVTLCSGAGWFGGFLSPQKAAEVYKTNKVCLAGSGAATGEAEITPNGYKISGTWKYASGAHHATHFTANCIIKHAGEVVLNKEGSPLIRPFIVESKDVTVFPAWKYIGMAATGSDAFEIKDLQVTRENCFEINAAKAVVKSALYQFPFLQMAEATLAVNICGMAIHFIDLCKEIFPERIKSDRLTANNKVVLMQILAEQEDTLNAIRGLFYEAVDASWADVENGITESAVMEQVSITSRKLAKIARECVDTLYPYCGLIAASTESEINQVWRDLHTASQHTLLTFINP